MDIINFSESENYHYFEINFSLNYVPLIPIIGFKGTSNLVDSFYISFIENLTKAIQTKFKENNFSFDRGEIITFKSYRKEINEFALNLLKGINQDSEKIIRYIDKQDLAVEDEQKEFFDRIIPYYILSQLVGENHHHKNNRGKI